MKLPLEALPLEQALRLSYVPRWVIVPMMRQQSVADHSWRVAIIAAHVANRLGLTVAPGVMALAVLHDLDEVRTGDTPATMKSSPIDPTTLGDLDRIVKVADMIEAISWAKLWAHPDIDHAALTKRLHLALVEYAASLVHVHPQAVSIVADILKEAEQV